MSTSSSRKRRRDSKGSSSNNIRPSRNRSNSGHLGHSNGSHSGHSRNNIHTYSRNGGYNKNSERKQNDNSKLKSSSPSNTNNGNNINVSLMMEEIGKCCDCNDCDIFISYIYHTNGQSLYNILLLQYNLKFENFKCCHPNCNIKNDGENDTFYVCLHCVFYCCSQINQHLISHCKQQKHYLYFELSSQSIFCCKCGEYHSSPWTDSMITKFIKMSQKRLLSLKNKQSDKALVILLSSAIFITSVLPL